MNPFAAVALSTATLAAVILGSGSSSASATSAAGAAGSSGTWPAAYPLPTSPGKVISQSSTTAVVRSTDPVRVVQAKLDALYLVKMGCVQRLGVNRPRDYLCYNAATKKSDEVLFTFAALDPQVTDPSASQSNAFFFRG